MRRIPGRVHSLLSRQRCVRVSPSGVDGGVPQRFRWMAPATAEVIAASLQACEVHRFINPSFSGSISHRAGREEMLASDSDRELVVEILREQHIVGRLDSAEFEHRLERCLAADSHAELHAITADLPTLRYEPWVLHGSSGSPGTDPGGRAAVGRVRSVVRSLAGLVAILVLAIWALTGAGYFWPAWVWFGLALPVGLDVSLRWAWRRQVGVKRRAHVLWTLVGFLEGACVVVWLLTAMSGSVDYFWPAWPLLGFVAIAGSYSAVSLGASASGRSG